MPDYRLSGRADAQLDEILAWSGQRFGAQARLRYAALLVAAFEDVAENPRRPAIAWRQLSRRRVGVYHISHSRDRVDEPPGTVGAPRHYLVMQIGADGVVDILGFMHDRMLLRPALLRILQANDVEP